MQAHPHQSVPRERRYLLLSIFDVSLNLALCAGVLAFGCALLGVILVNNGPFLLAQVSYIAGRILAS